MRRKARSSFEAISTCELRWRQARAEADFASLLPYLSEVLAIQREIGNTSEIHYQLLVAMPDGGDWQPNEAVPDDRSGLTRSTHRLVTLKALCGPGDNLEPVVTIMLPSED